MRYTRQPKTYRRNPMTAELTTILRTLTATARAVHPTTDEGTPTVEVMFNPDLHLQREYRDGSLSLTACVGLVLTIRYPSGGSFTLHTKGDTADEALTAMSELLAEKVVAQKKALEALSVKDTEDES